MKSTRAPSCGECVNSWKKKTIFTVSKKSKLEYFHTLKQDGDYACTHMLGYTLGQCNIPVSFTATAAQWTQSFTSRPPARSSSWPSRGLSLCLLIPQSPPTFSQPTSAGRRTPQTRPQTQASGAAVQSAVRLRRSGHGRAQLQRWRSNRPHQRGWAHSRRGGGGVVH